MAGRLRGRVTGPLATFAVGFADDLAAQGYTGNSIHLQMLLMAHLSHWLAAEALDVRQLVDPSIDRFLQARRAAGYAHHRTAKAMRPLLCYLRRLGVIAAPSAQAPSGPIDVVLDSYQRYLVEERGVQSMTAFGYMRAVRPFLCARLAPDGLALDLADLSATDITAFVVAKCPHQSRGSAKLTVTALRSLLNYLHVEGLIERSLLHAVPAIAQWRLAELPKGLEPEEVQRLLASCDRRTRKGRRDFGILTVLARLGLRAGEVAALGLDDIDWRAGEIVVRGKGNRTERLPLPSDVGEAVAAYLRYGRPATTHGRSVFVRSRAPLRQLTSSGVSQVVAAAGRRAGLGQIRAHRLRHYLATQMLRAGASLREVGQVLRHRRVLTTAIYAKVDRDSLRTIARRWPGGDR